MTEAAKYCKDCNRRFAVDLAVSKCPECDTELVSWHGEPTLPLEPARFSHVQSVNDKPEPASALVGTQLANYQIEEFLGQGGMARVYRAKHLTLERPCAIKVLRPATIERDKNAAEAFLAEARSAAALVHPHVVALHTIGEAKGRTFIEMEYVDGNSLSHLLQQEGKLDPLEATRIMLQVSSALAAAHEYGMVHRDIKPGNVMITASRNAKLADFGLAKQVATTVPVAGNALCGTPNYMAPELFTGQPATKQSDIYAMGVTYYSLLTGQLPILTQSINELVRFHAKQTPIDVSLLEEELPSGVIRILRQSLSTNKEERFVDASELHAELAAMFSSLRPLRSLLEQALQRYSVEIVENNGSFAIDVPLPNDRQQSVRIEINQDAETGESIVRVFSICAIATSDFYERALKLNAKISHGSVGIDTIDGEPHFVMVDSYPQATCDPEEIRKSVLEIAKHSDEVEHLLTGEDRF